MKRTIVFLWSIHLFFCAGGFARAQLPLARLFSVFPPGGKAGTSFEVSISGADLEGLSQLRFSHPGITAKPKIDKTTGKPEPHRFMVDISAEVPPRIYEARAAGRFGISNPRAFVVSDAREIVETGATNHIASAATPIELGMILNGRAESQAIDYFRFSAKKGKRILIRAQAKELDSKMEASLILHDSSGRELHRNRLGGLIDFVAPYDGQFLIQLHDFLYRGGDDYFYRLNLGTGPHIDYIFPPAGLPGSKSKYRIYGRNLPGGTPGKERTIEGSPLEQLTVEIALPDDPSARQQLDALAPPLESFLDGIEYRLRTPDASSNPVLLGLATAPIILEQDPNDEPENAQNVSLPCEWIGQFYPKDDRDWIQFEAKKGEVYWLELFSQRLGLPTDPFVLVQHVTQDDSGKEKVSDIQELYDTDTNIGGVEFNTATRDPIWRFEIKEEGTYRLQARDLFNQTKDNPALVYRLCIRMENPDFRLIALPQPPRPLKPDAKEASLWTPFLRRGETIPIKVLAQRRDNFKGQIELSVEGLPPGVTHGPAKIDADKNSELILLQADEEASEWVGPITVVGKAKIGDGEVTRQASGASLVWGVSDYSNEPVAARKTLELALAVSGKERAPVSLQPGEQKVWELAANGKVRIPFKMARHGGFEAGIKLKPAGLAALDSIKEFEVDGKASSTTFEIDLSKQKIPSGTHTFYLEGRTQGKYRKLTSEEAIAIEAELKQAQMAAQQAEKAAADSSAKTKELSEALAAAAKALEQAEAVLKAAAQKLEAAKEAAQKTDAPQELIAAKARAEKELAEAESKLKSVQAAKEAADKSAADAAAQAKEAEAKKTEAAKQVTELNKKLELQDVTVTFYSPAIQIKVNPAPEEKK